MKANLVKQIIAAFVVKEIYNEAAPGAQDEQIHVLVSEETPERNRVGQAL